MDNEVLKVLKEMQEDIKALKGMQKDINSMQEDIKVLKGMQKDISSMQRDINSMQGDISSMKEDITLIKEQQKEHTGILRSLEHAGEEHKAQIDNLSYSVARIEGEVKEIRKDLTQVEMVTASNWNDIAKLKAVR